MPLLGGVFSLGGVSIGCVFQLGGFFLLCACFLLCFSKSQFFFRCVVFQMCVFQMCFSDVFFKCFSDVFLSVCSSVLHVFSCFHVFSVAFISDVFSDVCVF